MDGWLKGLVAAACIAVLAAVGYYFWAEYSAAQDRAIRASNLAAIRAQVFKDAEAAPGDFLKVERHCSFVRDNRDSNLFGDYAKIASSRCQAAGF